MWKAGILTLQPTYICSIHGQLENLPIGAIKSTSNSHWSSIDAPRRKQQMVVASPHRNPHDLKGMETTIDPFNSHNVDSHSSQNCRTCLQMTINDGNSE